MNDCFCTPFYQKRLTNTFKKVIDQNLKLILNKISGIMRKNKLIFVILALIFMGCNDEEKDFAEQYDELMKENDRIEQVHNNFKNSRDELIQNHQEVMRQMETMEFEDSTIVLAMAQHEVILKKHEGILAGHEEMLQGHKELKQNFGNLSTDQIKAQIIEMENVQERIKQDQNTMRQEHERLIEDHQKIRGNLREDTMDITFRSRA